MAVTIKPFPGGAYADALWSGEFVVTYWGDNTRVTTHLGDIPTQDGVKPGYVRCDDTGGFKFAGQANKGGDTIEYVGGQWVHRPVVPCGNNPVIYDRDGNLVINIDCKAGSNGFRYVDPVTGAIVTGDATYASDFGLSEWSYAGGGIYVGQSNIEPGVGIWDGTVLRQLTRGVGAIFVRVSRSGDNFAVAAVQLSGQPTIIARFTLADIPNLPVPVGPPPPPPPPEPVPVPPQPPLLPPTPFFPRSKPMNEVKVYLKRGGKYLGIDPTDAKGTGEQAFPVYADRAIANVWEAATLSKDSSGNFHVKFDDAARFLCIRPDGVLESRDAIGPWETFYATEQPDGAKFLYRKEDGNVVSVLEVEVR